MGAPDLSVVIPSWNGAEALRAHLPSVVTAAGAAGGAEVVVCDDGSDDGTDGILRREFPGVRVVRRATRGGFARAANDGIGAGTGRRVVLLNNDMEVRPDALARLAVALDASPGAFAVVPSIVRVASGEDEARTRLRFRRGVVSTSIDAPEGIDPAYACGGAMAFLRGEFDRLGGFDPLFAPFYWEDVDLSYRARKRGMTIRFVPDARVDHDHGRTIAARFERGRIARVYERNRLVFTWKNLTDPALWRRHLAALPAKTLWDLAVHPAFVRGLGDALRVRRDVAVRRDLELRGGSVRDRDLLR